ncbi:16S rRNA (cytidine(1402)-2'-O)-methyltransferase [Pelagibacterales bacterium SAG-MED39]|nr:16S rRNA (cytidine(1402)-2'-O)-methyltransferase [Pelagibacterales bacterium SAG-MED39]
MIVNPKLAQSKIKNGLYIVATPIGNLNDISSRAITILKKSEYILCEDTRKSRNLLNRFDIKSKLISYHKFNEKKISLEIIKLLKNGKIISIISDAGTPGISDPGKILVNECVKYQIDVIPIPGASAVSAAVSISGFSEKFFFYGFFPEKKKDLELDLKTLSEISSCIVFFISPKKINKIIPFLKKNFSKRKIVICREISKFYEEYIRQDIDKLEIFDKKIKGELTIVISEKFEKKNTSHKLKESDKRMIELTINKLSIKEINDLINYDKKVPKKEIYDYCLKLKNEK